MAGQLTVSRTLVGMIEENFERDVAPAADAEERKHTDLMVRLHTLSLLQ